MKISNDGSSQLQGEVEVVCGGGVPEMNVVTQLSSVHSTNSNDANSYLEQV